MLLPLILIAIFGTILMINRWRYKAKESEISIVLMAAEIWKMLSFWNKNSPKDLEKKPKSIHDLPAQSSWSIIWNIIFCRNKVQNYDSLCGSFILQMVTGIGVANSKKKIGRFSWGGYNYILFFHPETAQEVLKSNTIIDKDWSYNILHPWLGEALLTSTESKWRIRRKLITPSFHFRILEDFQEIFYEQSNILIEKFKHLKGEVFDVTEVVERCALDVIGETAMGVSINAQDQLNNLYAVAVKGISFAVLQWFTKPWYWIPLIFNHSSLGKTYKKNIKTVHDFDKKVIQEKKGELIRESHEENNSSDFAYKRKDSLGIKKRQALLDMLLHHHMKNGSLDEKDIRQEVDGVMLAGQDTSTMGISWTLYFLGIHKDIQEKVFEELDDIFGLDIDREITTDDLKRMKYLECVIKESLRIYPPVPFIFRKNPSEIIIGEHTLPANSSFTICIYGIHHNPTVFENPEVFDPDRFLPVNCEKRHPFAFLPFSAGPRNCIGQKFAMMEMKTVLANVLRHFKVNSLDPRDKILVSADIVLRPVDGIRLTLLPRRKCKIAEF